MSTQSEFAAFKLLLKQLYSAHSTKVRELENEVKNLKEKLAEKERESNKSLSECKRCVELEEAFKSCKKALHDQSKMFENFGKKFSIFNSTGLENHDLNISNSQCCTVEEIKSPKNFRNDAMACDKNESSIISLGETTITENKINGAEKVPSVQEHILKNIMHDDGNPESFDVYTVTFPQHLKEEHSTAKCTSLILAPDSLDTTPDAKKVCERRFNDNNSNEFQIQKLVNPDEQEKIINTEKENKGCGKRLSTDSLNDDRVKRCNTAKKIESGSKLTKTKDVKNCNISPKIIVTDEISDTSNKVDEKTAPEIIDLNLQNVHALKKKNIPVSLVETKHSNKITNNLNFLNNGNKHKSTSDETSPSLLPINKPLKIIDLEAISNDNDDFQEPISSIKSVQNEDSWDACEKKKPLKKNRNIKSIKSTSKFKMTLDAPPLNYKKPTYKQTKLSKSLFQAKDDNTNTNLLNRISPSKNHAILEEDYSPMVLHDHFQTSTPYDITKSPFDIDATFIPENFRIETHSCATTSVKKNSIEKSNFKNGNLFSNISFPEELQSCAKNEDLNVNEIEDHPSFEDCELKESMNSFDRLPLPEEPAYKYKNDVVRKKSERRQLNGFDCKECEKYYSKLGLSDKEKKERMKKCSRHRGKYTPPPTPDHFWELEFPDTQECKARGYMDATQKVKLNNICNI